VEGHHLEPGEAVVVVVEEEACRWTISRRVLFGLSVKADLHAKLEKAVHR
jgi:hypothetical protein